MTKLLKQQKNEKLSFLASVPTQWVAFIASGGIVAGILISNSPLTHTVF